MVVNGEQWDMREVSAAAYVRDMRGCPLQRWGYQDTKDGRGEQAMIGSAAAPLPRGRGLVAPSDA